MNIERRKHRGFPLLLFVPGAVVAMLAGYMALNPFWYPALPHVDLAQVTWKAYRHPDLRYVVDFPDAFAVAQDGDEVTFTLDGSRIVWITLLTTEEADRRGRWAGHPPIADIELAGIAGKKYLYNHFDVGEGVETLAWVIPFEDKFLALEVRRRRVSCLEALGLISVTQPSMADIDAVANRMVESMRIMAD